MDNSSDNFSDNFRSDNLHGNLEIAAAKCDDNFHDNSLNREASAKHGGGNYHAYYHANYQKFLVGGAQKFLLGVWSEQR